MPPGLAKASRYVSHKHRGHVKRACSSTPICESQARHQSSTSKAYARATPDHAPRPPWGPKQWVLPSSTLTTRRHSHSPRRCCRGLSIPGLLAKLSREMVGPRRLDCYTYSCTELLSCLCFGNNRNLFKFEGATTPARYPRAHATRNAVYVVLIGIVHSVPTKKHQLQRWQKSAMTRKLTSLRFEHRGPGAACRVSFRPWVGWRHRM